jgi:signal transduction histidine kinase
MEKDSAFKGRIELRTTSAVDSVTIQVKDNGGGIPNSIITRIFEPFFTTKAAGKGTGQGLAICWDIIVRKHHGKLNVQSDPELGTTIFEICLPIAAVNV